MRLKLHRTQSLFRTVVVAAAAGLLVAACGGADGEDGSGDGKEAGSDKISHTGKLAKPADADDAFTYDEKLAPVDAELSVDIENGDAAAKFTLTVAGLQPDRGYAAHAHAKPCGETGTDAGPHFQHEADPAATSDEPSADADYANPENEVWLDLETDGEGNGQSTAEVPFSIEEESPQSVVVHANEKTESKDGEAGAAGDRVACLSIHDH